VPDIFIRNIKPETMAFLKSRAAWKHHTIQDEIREVLDELQERHRMSMEEARRVALEWQEHFRATGRDFSGTVEDIREDRDSDHGRD
jgi:plasmid stability protein